MATSALSILRKNNNKSILNKGQTVSEGVVAPVQEPVQEEREHNTNGLIGGLGYLGEKVGLGFLQGVEGIWDFTAGGIASLTGNDDWAKKQFDNDWVNYNHADEWYNPSSGWKFAGDITGGIGTSLPSIGAGLATIGIGAAITAASGGTGLPAYIGTIATIMSAAAGGLSAAGNATKEAYQKTGELGIKEYAYGTAMGGIEAGLELATAGIGAGTGRIIKEIGESVAGSTAKKVATSVGKETFVKTILKNGIKDFAGEAFEEGVNTAIAPYIQRATYDPTAENATVQDIMYSSVVGGFSGLLMGGANTAVSTGKSLATGNRLTQNSLANTVLEMGREISTAEDQYSTGYESFANVKKLYNELSESIKSTNGQVQTVKQKILLGELNNQATAAIMEPMVERSAMKILSNPEVTAERVSAYLTKASGQKVEITAQDLMANIDTSSQENYVKSLRKALSSNQKLIALAVADATGTMMLDTKAFEEATLQGKNFATQDDFNRFLETAKKDELKSVGEALGIEKWEGITYAEFQEKMGEFSANGNLASSIEQTKRINEAKNIPEAQAKNKIPSAFSMKEDGAIRYAEGNVDIAVIKQGDKYFVYDYVDGNITRSLSRTELNSLLNQVKEHNISFEQARTQRESEMSKLAKNFDTYCNDNIKDYRSLTEPKRGMIRAIIRDAKAKGISDADALTYARVSARTGIEIEFNKEALKLGKIKGTEELVYADGVYDGKQNKIIVNPETKRTHESLLLHELTHAINKDREGRLVLLEGVKNMSTEEKQSIIKRYMEAGRDGVVELIDELDAHYVEGQLSNKNLLEKLLADKPTLKDKILSFFKKVMGDSEDVKLSSKAKALFNHYKKLFDSFSQRPVKAGVISESRYAFVGRMEDGRGIYRTNYSKNTPKIQKQKDIVNLVQNVWSKKPIKLKILEDGKSLEIEAKFNPELNERSDLSKIAFGNRKGNASEKRITLNLSSDLYQIASESRYVRSKKETGKENIAHTGVSQWHYFLTNLVYEETDGSKIDCYMNIDVKQNDSGNWFYSFAIEKGVAPPTLLAVVTEESATTPNNSITQPKPKVNTESKKSFALPKMDKEYADALKNKDVEKMQELVDAAAKAMGYNSPKLYHGTKSFGFTAFDLSKMDDKRSIFLTSNPRIASTYSGVMPIREMHDQPNANIQNMTAQEVVNELNSDKFKIGEEQADEYVYKYLDLKAVNETINKVNQDIEDLKPIVESKIKQYADKMATEPDYDDYTAHSKLVTVQNALDSWDYDGLPTALYGALHYSNAFKAEGKEIAELEKNIRLVKKLRKNDNSNGVIVESWLEGYSLELLTLEEAKERLTLNNQSGNYSLYAKLGNCLTIDAKGAVWRDIRHWTSSLEVNKANTEVKKEGDEYVLYDKNGTKIEEGSVAVNYYTSNMDMDRRHMFLIEKANMSLRIQAENMHTTREIAEFAQARGYDSVLFKDLRDNGGLNSFVKTDEKADIYVVFNPKNIKSADPVTFDDAGKVVPLSKRYNDSKNELRYSLPSTDSQGNKLSAEQIEYFKDSKIRDEKGNLLVVRHGTNAEFNIFDFSKAGKNGKQEGFGFYFSDDLDITKRYGEIQKEVFLNITKPLYSNKRTIKKSELVKLTNALIDFNIKKYKSEGLTWQDTFLSNYVDTYSYSRQYAVNDFVNSIWESNTNDQDLVFEIASGDGRMWESSTMKEFYDVLTSSIGYDGIIAEWTHSEGKSKVYVTFNSEQSKLVTNQKPTSNPDIRYAIPDDVKAPLDMTDSIKLGTPSQYKAGFKDKLFSAKISAVIDFIDEMHGAEIFLKRSGVENAEATINMMRVAASQAQTMTGSVQYDIYGDKKKLGDGIQKIIAPIEKQGKETYTAFNEYLLHLHNIDRMTLESRTRAWNEDSKKKLESKQLEYSLKEKAIETADKNISKLKAAKKKLTRKKADMAKRERYNSEIEKSIEQKEKIKKEMAVLGREIKKLQSEVDNFIPMENKPVFGVNEARGRSEAITAEQSQERANTLEKQYPEFKEKAEEVHRYFKNLLHMDVQTGKITSEQEEYMNKLYPRYVPTIRDGKQPGVKPVKGKHDYKVNTDIKTAIGGGEDVLEIAYSGASRTQQVIRSGNVNLLAQKIYEAHLSTGDNTYVEVVSTKKMTPEEIADINYDDASMRPKNNQVTFFYNGEYITMKVSKEIFAAFEALDNPSIDFNSTIMKGINKVNKIYKTLVTSYSPAFILRNPIRDLQDAGLNSKNPVEFAKNLPLAYKEIASNGKYWELYRAMGGFSSSVFDTQKGFTSKVGKRGLSSIEKNAKGIIKSPFTMIENANVVVEQATRLAEFMASLKKGNTAEQALLDSAEVTTNFGRKGKLAKKLNATVMPFLNPAIQGADKIYRNVKDAFVSKNKAKAFALLITKAALIGIVPHVLNMLMYKDDEDYEILDETVKENYYLFKVGDKFIRIPKGRLVSVLAGAANRITLMARGKDSDIKSYLKNISTQITPVDSMSRTIFSPFVDVATNTTWYGSAIEGRQFENTAPRDRYDESTSSIAIVIGQAINYSPKKIHYLLDQYSGVIGDFILPATTKKAEKDYISNSFVTDPVVSNKLSSEFYKLYDQAQYGKTAGDDKSTYYVKYLNETKSAVNKVYKEISEIQNSNSSSAEKLQQTRVLRIAINNMYKSAINDYEIVGAAIEATAGVDEKFRYTEIVHLVYGAERALETYDDKVYEKCSLFNNAGIDYETLYYYYFATLGLESDVDNEGNTIAGSKRGKIIEIINSLNVSDEEKLLLLCYRGYSIKDGDIKGLTKESALVKLAKHLKSAKTLNNEQKEKLAELCGLKYKNGKIIVPASYKWRKNNKSSVLSLIKGG